MKNIFEYNLLKVEVLNWLEKLRVSETTCKYHFSANSEATIFTTCFALFIKDLFKETDKFSNEERNKWINYIQSFQNEEYGYFEPTKYYHPDKERNRYQLTCFCLSALKILDAEPKYPLCFVDKFWPLSGDIDRYLFKRECNKGISGSGNKAMFLAIFLTYEYERTGRKDLLRKINTWFDFHNKYQNPKRGCWGNNDYYRGLQNGYHQYEIYYYWDRPINYYKRIIDTALKVQNIDGSFSPIPGGEGCHDYDIANILVNFYINTNYKQNEIRKSLLRAINSIYRNKNKDGGFCQSKLMPTNLFNLLKILPLTISKNPFLLIFKIRAALRGVIKKQIIMFTGWTESLKNVKESNLWDTWIRCLALAQIERIINSNANFNFQKMIGIGYSDFWKNRQYNENE